MSGFRLRGERKISGALCSPGSRVTKSPRAGHACLGNAPSERFFMAVALVRPTRAVVCGLIAALMAAAGGGACGGGGEARLPDAAGQDAPVTIDTGTPDKPAKTLGEPCATSLECGSALCVEGVCCNEACDKACFT